MILSAAMDRPAFPSSPEMPAGVLTVPFDWRQM
jgi:hypothetical protein